MVRGHRTCHRNTALLADIRQAGELLHRLFVGPMPNSCRAQFGKMMVGKNHEFSVSMIHPIIILPARLTTAGAR
jgi:hypothetical protein